MWRKTVKEAIRIEESLLWLEGRRNCRGPLGSEGRRRRKKGYTGSRRRGSMIRHAFCRGGLRRGAGLAPPVSALAVTMIEAAFFGLLMAAIGDAVSSAACELATVDLLLITTWADEENSATARRATKALSKRSLTIISHVNTGHDGQPRPKMGKCGLTRLVLR
jgi:hypothetical protein